MRGTDKLATFMCRLSRNAWILNLLKSPKGLSTPVYGLLYQYSAKRAKKSKDLKEKERSRSITNTTHDFFRELTLKHIPRQVARSPNSKQERYELCSIVEFVHCPTLLKSQRSFKALTRHLSTSL
jgi:hypothetical protein